MLRTKQSLNSDARTAYDERNNEARKHEGHKLIIVRDFYRPHPTTNGYDEHDVICETCNVQFKAYVWRAFADKTEVHEDAEPQA
jgi:hypothetical protein